MDFYFENQGTVTYIVYEISENDVLDDMSLGMLTNNKIPGLAPTLFTQMDSKKFIKYNVSSKISVKQFFEGQVNRKRLIGVFDGILNAMMSIEEYMIDPNSIILDLDYIFADVSTCETVLICLPVMQNKGQTDLLSFFRNIMFSTQFDQTENCDHVARIINYLNSAPVFSLVDFKKVIDSLKTSNKSNSVKSVEPQVSNTNVSVQKTTQQVVAPVQQYAAQSQVQTPAPQPNPQPARQSVSYQIPQPPAQANQQPKKAKNKKNKKENIPAVPPAASKQANSVPEIDKSEKISLFTLLMHYSKENKAKYDAQKAAKKQKKDVAVPKQNAPKNNSFAIPGAPVPSIQPQKQTQPKKEQPVKPAPVQQPTQLQPQIPPQQQVAGFGETTVLGGGAGIGETTVLGASSPQVKIQPYLIRTKNKETIILDKPVFRIGKEKSYVDYFVSDNTAVSRSHANIITRDGNYYVVDTNSTNHTYVNGEMIQSNVETPLSNGAKIRLANEDFEFKMY